MFGSLDLETPDSWMPALVRIAGAETVPDLLSSLAALFHRVCPHRLAVLSAQYINLAFEDGRPARIDLADRATGLTVQSVATVLSDKPMILDAGRIGFLAGLRDRHGWRDILTLAAFERQQHLLTCALYRGEADPAFDPAEQGHAQTILTIGADALRRLLDRQRALALNETLLGFLHDIPVGLIMLDWSWDVFFVNREGYRQALVWNCAPGAPPRNADARAAFRVPEEIYAACNEVRNSRTAARAAGKDEDADPRTIGVFHPLRADLRCSVTASRNALAREEPPKFMVRFFGMATRTEADFEPTLEQLRLLTQLTPTERSIALLVRQGLSNREISATLHREVSTVKDHLTHIFEKLAIRSRVQLARLLS